MGSAIGINTMILLSSVLFIINDVTKYEFSIIQKNIIRTGYWITNISLLAFLIFLIIAGAEKGILVIENKLSFQAIMQKISPYLVSFAWAGLGIFTGLVLTTIPPLIAIFRYFQKK